MKKDFKIERIMNENGEYEYFLSSKDGEFDRDKVERWFEKSKNIYHLKLNDNQKVKTGREFFSERRYFDDKKVDMIEFNHKEGQRVINDWESRLNDNELKELKKAREVIDKLMKIGSERKPKSEVDILKNEIDKMKKLLELHKIEL